MKNFENLYIKIKNYEIISFDIFDTLVKRDVLMPKDIFDLVEKEYNKTHENKIKNFRKIRVQAEQLARQQSTQEEIEFEDIYKCINLASTVKDELKQLEIQIELKYCVPNYLLRPIFNRLIKEGKKIVLVSDMYLPQVVVEQILHKCGYTGYFRLYLSSTVKLQKAKGHLYDYVVKDLNVAANKIVHIGDGRITDYVKPLLHGLKVVHVPRYLQNTAVVSRKQALKVGNVLFSFMNNRLAQYSESKFSLFRLGYECLGPILYGYVQWIHDKIQEHHIEHTYFLARDMYLFVDIYKQMYGDKKISYLEISRKSLRKAYVVCKNNFEAYKDTLQRQHFTNHELADAFNIDEEDIEKLIANNKDLQIFQNDADKSLAYLQQENVFDDKKSALVDIGWHGTLQNMVEKVTGKDFYGLYFGYYPRPEFKHLEADAYWIKSLDETKALDAVSIDLLLEVMLFPNVGTTIGYQKKDNRILPVYAKCEMQDNIIVKQLQKGAKQFVKDIMTSGLDFDGSDFVYPMFSLAVNPTRQMAKILGILKYEDTITYPLAELKSLRHYLLHPWCLLIDLKNARWKEGFLKQILPFGVKPYWVSRLVRYRRKLGIGKRL